MTELGAYGFRIGAPAGAERWLVPQSPDAPILEIEPVLGAWDAHPSRADDAQADLRLLGGGRLLARADSGIVRFVMDEPPDVADLVHPYLAPAAALHSAWQGHQTLHAGAVVIDGGAVLVLGDKEAGKSTTLRQCDDLGLTVLADDLVALRDADVLAGPRSLDLRPAGSEPTVGQPVRRGERIRRRLGSAPSRSTVRGWVQLGWGEALGLEALDVSTRLALLSRQRSFPRLHGNPETILELLAVPAYRLTRPRDLAALEPAVRLLIDAFG